MVPDSVHGVDCGAAVVSVRARERQNSRAVFDQAAGAAHDPGVSAVDGLIENHRWRCCVIAPCKLVVVPDSVPALTVVPPL